MYFVYLFLSVLIIPVHGVMNKGGVPYKISNALGDGYSTDFEKNQLHGKVEHFDVYGEVRTNYSQIYWTRNNEINLPSAIVERFKDKVMVITGYEIDQVIHPGEEEGDVSVPIYNAYNHHYFSWLVGSDAEVYAKKKLTEIPNPTKNRSPKNTWYT
eukprot:GSMAST32.ASY1.ANO1.2793.1 assembled CDS